MAINTNISTVVMAVINITAITTGIITLIASTTDIATIIITLFPQHTYIHGMYGHFKGLEPEWPHARNATSSTGPPTRLLKYSEDNIEHARATYGNRHGYAKTIIRTTRITMNAKR